MVPPSHYEPHPAKDFTHKFMTPYIHDELKGVNRTDLLFYRCAEVAEVACPGDEEAIAGISWNGPEAFRDSVLVWGSARTGTGWETQVEELGKHRKRRSSWVESWVERKKGTRLFTPYSRILRGR